MAFHPQSIIKAKSRLRIVAKAIGELEEAKNHTEFSDVWYTFLVAAKNVYTSLEQGSKTSPGDQQWFGGIKALRRADPMLQYLFQARDDDEHGLEEVTEYDPGGLAIGVNKPGFTTGIHIHNMTFDDSGLINSGRITAVDNKPILVEIREPQTVLKTVTGRGPVKYPPPTIHLGEEILDIRPIPIAKMALSYLESVVKEAEGRA